MDESIKYQDAELHYRVFGKGPVVVLLHGFLESKAVWYDFLPYIGGSFQVVIIDLPGHGQSTCPRPVYAMDFMADCVCSVMQHLKVDQFVLVGHSMGGYVAMAFARRYSALLKGLVLFHSHALPDDAEQKSHRDRTITIVNQRRAGFIQQFIPDLFAVENREVCREAIQKIQSGANVMLPQAVVAALAGMRDRLSAIEVLSGLRVPVLFILGKEDVRMPVTRILAQCVLPHHAESLVLGRCGHMGFIEQPGVTGQAIEYFAFRCSKGVI